MNWERDDRYRTVVTGWFAIDDITFMSDTSNVVTALDLRFEQYCDDGTAALHGKVHWAAEE